VNSLKSAFVIIDIYLIMGVFFRFGREAKKIKTTEKDKKSTPFIGIVYVFNIVILLATFLFERFHAGILFNNSQIAFWGNLIMVLGLFIRIYSVWTLKEFYTRTLIIQPNQRIIESGLYKSIRHPGYLGSIMVWLGAGISSNNYIVLILVTISTVLVYHYRMKNEEKMLIEAFGNDYADYIKRTKRLIPLVY